MRRWPSACSVERWSPPSGGLVAVVCLLLVLTSTPEGRAAFERAATAARPAALASYACCPDIAASLLSPEGEHVSRAPRWVLGASAFELFGLSELRGYGLRLERRGALSVSVGAEQFGSELYVERSLSAGSHAHRKTAGEPASTSERSRYPPLRAAPRGRAPSTQTLEHESSIASKFRAGGGTWGRRA